MHAAPPERETLRRSELARMQAQLATMPVIEQAKGIIMAQGGCGEVKRSVTCGRHRSG
jgi:AmiR/NasT family two-component response regulator